MMLKTDSATYHQEECIQLIQHSNRLYRLMLDTLGSITEHNSSSSPEKVTERTIYLNKVHYSIEENDKLVSSVLDQTKPRCEIIDSLLDERKELLEKLIKKNREVTRQIESVKSLLAEEMKKIKSGHLALSGYRQQTSGPKKNSFSCSL